jgi:hypothetical protein
VAFVERVDPDNDWNRVLDLHDDFVSTLRRV